ncbi:MAG TPA: hypothetical protein VG496_18375, partial [Myxococcales bacterium]|nr:hypothetical protein [Myxococcales bacterium]
MAEVGSKERSLLKKALSPSYGCATPLELSHLADGSLAQAGAARLRDHVSRCARCQTELTLLKEFENATPGPYEESAVHSISARLERRLFEASTPRARTRSSPLQARHGAARPRRSMFSALNVGGFALAAGTLAAALVIGLRERRIPELVPPSPAGPMVLRSAGITTLSPAGDLDAAPDVLHWEPHRGAASYSVQVMEVDYKELW